jgi:hypothetical protein
MQLQVLSTKPHLCEGLSIGSYKGFHRKVVLLEMMLPSRTNSYVGEKSKRPWILCTEGKSMCTGSTVRKYMQETQNALSCLVWSCLSVRPSIPTTVHVPPYRIR